ncbi:MULTISPECIES: DUF2515 family protein [unclassified Sutcliffiella]|uniref:DUF2515 family protein n=1 Tax=unclassified Sutcliffiella TaxID=2837532 RepID=UPI0030CB74FD
MLSNWFSGASSKPKNKLMVQVWTSADKEQLTKEWTTSTSTTSPNAFEQELILEIRNKTSNLNHNNVTRTNAYLDYYLKHPEVHWSLLAHMVSRNGGWNMTDLKASHISTLLSYEKTSILFRFLEKANHLIFQDAYPQLLLYEESKKLGRSLFHLLSEFHVSPFMNPIWTLFWDNNKKKELLTVSLIINEQSFIEYNLLQNPFFQQKVLSSFTYQLQEKLGFTLVLFPYLKGSNTFLTGLKVQQFSNLATRIEIGKELYVLLFKNQTVLQGCLRFSREKTHSGSRADYFPSVFSSEPTTARKIYSPTIEASWADYDHTPITPVAWFKDIQDASSFFYLPSSMVPADMEKTHLYNVMKLTGMSELHGIFFESEK